MRKPAVLLQVLVFVFAAAFAQGAWAATLYVAPAGTGDGLTPAAPANLQAALDAARVNGEADTLLLATGVYDAGAAGANTFEYDAGLAGSDGLAVALEGGWWASFTSRTLDPAATRLDGGGTARIFLAVAVGASAVADLSFDALTFRSGKTTPETVPAHGAAILSVQSNGGSAAITATGCVFAWNLAESSVGGAIAAQGPITVSDSDFVANQAYSGGAVYLWPTATQAVFTSCGFADNSIRNPASPTAPYGWQGSTIFSHSPDLIVDGCEFSGMFDGSTSGAGSTIYVHTGGHLTARNSSFQSVSILAWGSAIQLWDAGASISGCLFANNRAGGPPGGSGYAAVTYLNNSGAAETTSIVNSTFVGNRSDTDYAGDLHFRGGTLTVSNSIFFDTSSGNIVCTEGCSGTFDYNDVAGGAGSVSGLAYGPHNISAAPNFAADDQEYRLPAGSPCIDAGDNAAVPAALATDYEGNPRIFGANDFENPLVDMGWDEYYDGELSLTRPADHTIWLPDGNIQPISWTCTKIPGNVRLSLWRGSPAQGGKQVRQIAASVPCAARQHWWNLPPTLPDRDDYAVVIESLSLPALVEWNWVAIRHLVLIHPNWGHVWQGTTYWIKWKSGGLPGALVKIEVYQGDRRKLLVSSGAPNTGWYGWKVPFTMAATTGYKMRLSTASPRVAEDWSDYTFRVLPAVTLTAPNGGEAWRRGSAKSISWTYKDAPPGPAVRLELYRNGAFDRTIAESVPIGLGGAVYHWRIPATLPADTTYRVKVSSVTYPKVFDFSNGTFSITE